jgi:hypothetical protein
MADQTTINQTTSLIEAVNPDFLTVAAFSVVGILVMLNLILRFPDLGLLIAQYNQF